MIKERKDQIFGQDHQGPTDITSPDGPDQYNFLNKGITISILEPIKPDYSKEEFLGILEKTIYSELKLLN